MQEDWFGENYANPESSVWEGWFEARNDRRTFARIRSSGVTHPGRMLEIGIGSGSLLAFMNLDYAAGKQRKLCSSGQPHDMVKEIDR